MYVLLLAGKLMLSGVAMVDSDKRKFRTEAAEIYKPITSIAFVLFATGAVALVILGYEIFTRAETAEESSARFWIVFGLGIVYSFLFLYLQYLLLRAFSLGIKHLSTLADFSYRSLGLLNLVAKESENRSHHPAQLEDQDQDT